MMRIVQDPKYPINSELILGIDRNLYDIFKIAYDKGQKETVKVINTFHQQLLFDAFGHRAPEIINQLIFLPVYFYHVVSKNDELRAFLVESVSVAFKTSSFFFRESTIESSDKNSDRGLEIACAEKFYEGVLAFYHSISAGTNDKEIEHAYNEFNWMQGDMPRSLYVYSKITVVRGNSAFRFL